MFIRLFLFCFLLIFSVHLFSQERAAITDLAKINIVGLSYEKSMGTYRSLYANGFLSASFAYSYSSSFGSEFNSYVVPGVGAQYRFYYNAAKREAKGKRTALNNQNYLAPALETIFSKRRLEYQHIDEPNPRPVSSLGLLWGMQRNYPKHFSLDLSLGYGVVMGKTTQMDFAGGTTSKNRFYPSPLGWILIGFWLNNK